MQVIESYPNILAAFLDMEACNGGLHRDRDREAMLRATDPVIGADGITHAELLQVDAWIGALSEDKRLIFVDGEESEKESLCGNAGPVGQMADGLFNDLFET